MLLACRASVSQKLICGIATATFGGAVRDLTLRSPIRILHSQHTELYAMAAAAAAAVYMAARVAGAPLGVKVGAGVAAAVAARAAGWKWGVRMAIWPGAGGDVDFEARTALIPK